MNSDEKNSKHPQRAYPEIYEKIIPVVLVILVAAIVLLLFIIAIVVLGDIPGVR